MAKAIQSYIFDIEFNNAPPANAEERRAQRMIETSARNLMITRLQEDFRCASATWHDDNGKTQLHVQCTSGLKTEFSRAFSKMITATEEQGLTGKLAHRPAVLIHRRTPA